jgi:glucokinase
LFHSKIDNKADADVILNQWAEAILRSISFIDKNRLVGIGFAMPGPFDYENGIAMFTHEVAKIRKFV